MIELSDGGTLAAVLAAAAAGFAVGTLLRRRSWWWTAAAAVVGAAAAAAVGALSLRGGVDGQTPATAGVAVAAGVVWCLAVWAGRLVMRRRGRLRFPRLRAAVPEPVADMARWWRDQLRPAGERHVDSPEQDGDMSSPQVGGYRPMLRGRGDRSSRRTAPRR